MKMQVVKTTYQNIEIYRIVSSGNIHREDGPAMIFPNGTKKWYQHNKFHRENGPAIEWSDGDRYWYINDNFHRFNGPAIEHNSYQIGNAPTPHIYYIYGVRIEKEKYIKIMLSLKRCVEKFKKQLRLRYIKEITNMNIYQEKYISNIIADYLI